MWAHLLRSAVGMTNVLRSVLVMCYAILVQPWKGRPMDGRTDRRTDGRLDWQTDATKYIISLASRSIINAYYLNLLMRSIIFVEASLTTSTIFSFFIVSFNNFLTRNSSRCVACFLSPSNSPEWKKNLMLMLKLNWLTFTNVWPGQVFCTFAICYWGVFHSICQKMLSVRECERLCCLFHLSAGQVPLRNF